MATMVNKQWIKLVKSLQIKKYRKENKLFFIEGAKNILDIVGNNAFEIEKVFLSPDFSNTFNHAFPHISFEIASEKELVQMGSLKSNNAGIVVMKIPTETRDVDTENQELTVILDDIQDPGNLGTIVRICDWYGVKNIICSPNTVDIYNFKSISATMGSLGRVNIKHIDLISYLKKIKKTTTYGMFLEGESVYNNNFHNSENSIIIIGSESHGISDKLMPFINKKITIPRFGLAESLNAGIATAVVLDNYKRQTTYD